ncbi:MAG TPA: MFS transporter [Holophaga sp.]|nr:MFS transporter [Holophaga sp.]
MTSHTPRETLFTGGFVLVSALTFLTFFAAFQLFPTVPLRLIELGATVGQSGRFMAVFTIGSSFGALFTGPLGDRLGQRRTIVGSTLVFTALLVAYGFLSGPWWWFCVLALPHGVAWSGLLTATMAAMGGVLPEDRRAEGMTIYGLASPAGVIFGPMLGMAIYARWHFQVIAFGLGAVFLALAALAFILPKDPERRERRSAFQKPDRTVAGPCSVFFATALGYGVLGSYTAQEGLKLGLPMPSAFLTFMAVGMVGMRVAMSLRGFEAKPVRQLPAMLWITCAGLALLALLPGGMVRHALSALLYGAGYSMVHTLLNTHVLEVTPPERRGAAFGATLFSFDVGISLGNFAIGSFIGWAYGSWGAPGFRLGWGLCALMALAAVPLAARMLRQAGD